MNKNIKDIVSKKNWNFLVKNFLPVNIVDIYSFTEAMKIVGYLELAANAELLNDSHMTDFMRDFCVNLMIILRARHPKEWKEDWKNEAFLGIACSFVYREEEAFIYITNAFERLTDPPQSLILAYIGAREITDHPFSKREITELSQKALKKGITYELALQMVDLSQEEEDEEKKNYWKQQAIEAEKKKVHTPIIVPNILKEIFQEENGYKHEEE